MRLAALVVYVVIVGAFAGHLLGVGRGFAEAWRAWRDSEEGPRGH